MKYSVCFDLSQLAHGGGVGTYTAELANQLAKSDELEMKWFYSSLRKPYGGPLKNVRNLRIPPSILEPLVNKWRLVGVEQIVGSVDVYHSSDWIQMPTEAKKVTTYHDVIPIKYPEWSDPKVVKVHRRRLKLVEKEIDLVIAVSHSTKQDLIELTKIPKEKIVIIYEGVDERFKPQSVDDIASFRTRMGLPNKFVLGIGGIGSRRNLEKAKKAAGELPFLVTHQDITNISDDEMPLLYASAEMLLYPSLYEGFGLPILEAMAVGTIVVTSDRGAMKEIAGGAAVLVDPDSIESIVNGVKKASDPNTRKILSQKGITRAKEFSWDRCAKETADVYKELMK